MKALDTIKPDASTTTSSTSKILFPAGKEVAMSTAFNGTYGLGIHSIITNVATAGQYLSLILFTDDATKHLHCKGHTLKKIKSSIASITHHLLNLTSFPSEDSLNAFTWHEAWKHYLNWLKDVSDSKVYDY